MAKTKALISFAVTAKLICVLVFAYAKSRFSHDEAHFIHCDPVHTILIIKAFCLQSIGALTNDGRIQVISGNLTIQALRKSDHGVYECEASNEVRKIVTTTELVIQSKYKSRIWGHYLCIHQWPANNCGSDSYIRHLFIEI